MPAPTSSRPLAVVTGASSGIGLELALCCAEHGYDLLIAADRPLHGAQQDISARGARVEGVEVDLADAAGVETLCAGLQGRVPEVLIANAGHGLGKAFLDQDMRDVLHVVDTNISGTLLLIHRVGNLMRRAGTGRILITGSIAGMMPGAYQAVYNGSKAFIDSFSLALRNELKDSGVTVTCLMPGPTETDFFERAGLTDTKFGVSDSKMDPADVARIGFKAMLDGDADVVAGLKNKLQAAVSNITPDTMLAEQHRRMAEPGSGDGKNKHPH